MKLLEFFSEIRNFHSDKKSENKSLMNNKLDHDKMSDDVYWYMLDHDRIHKENFIPIAREMYRLKDSKNFDKDAFVEKFLPMVNRGCMEYYKEMKLEEDPRDIFTKEMRRSLCQRLTDQSYEDVLNDEYNLGD
jgi:hypothetical protein